MNSAVLKLPFHFTQEEDLSIPIPLLVCVLRQCFYIALAVMELTIL